MYTNDGPGHGRRTAFATLIIILVALTNFRAILPIFRDHLMQYLAINDRGFGFMFSIPQFLTPIPLLLVGWLIARLGAQRVLTRSFILFGLGMGGVAFCGASWQGLSGALAITTVACVLLEVSSNCVLVELFPGGRRRVLSLCMAARSVTETIVPLLAEWLLGIAAASPTIGFAMVFHVPFGVIAGAFIAGGLLIRHQAADRTEAPWNWRDLLISRRSVGLVALALIHGTADGTLFTWMARFLGSAAFTEHPFPPGFVLAAFSIAYIVSRLLLAHLPEHWGRDALLVVPGLLGGGIMVAAILSRSYVLTAAGYVVGAFFWSTEYPALLGRLAEIEGKRFGAAMALASMVTAIGYALGLMASGALIQAVGETRMWIPMLALASGFPCVGLGGLLWLGTGRMRTTVV